MRVEFDPVARWVSFDCPGCGMTHLLNVDPALRPRWSFNGDLDRPTLQPSILAKSGHYGDRNTTDCWCNYEERTGKPTPFSCGVCHSFVRDGRIEFLPDCTHALAGQTVELPEIGRPAATT